MKGLLENIRSRTRSPPLSRSFGAAGVRRPSNYRPRQGNGTQTMGSHIADEELQEALAASLAVEGGQMYPVGSGLGGAAYPADDDTAIAAAIGASLDTHEENLKGGHVGGDSNDSPTPSTVPGSHASQDLAFLTDAPLLPPAAARDGSSNLRRGIWGPMDGGTSRTGGGAGGAIGASGRPGAGGAMFGVSNPVVPSARRRTRGVVAAPGAQQRNRTDEDEALARRLQEQWISEDRVAGGGRGSHWPGQVVTNAPASIFMRGIRQCAGCGLPITDATFMHGPAGNFHLACSPRAAPRLPPCRVCHESLPSQNGRIHFYRHNFFNDVYCPWHHDSAPRCCSCMRLEPMEKPGDKGEGPFAELQDGRMVCMACAQTSVVDSAEGAPAYLDVCRFFEQELNLSVPREMREVPVLLVDSPTLNEQTHRDPSHGGGVERGMPTTRGLTLSEVATVKHMATGAMHFNASIGRFVVGPPTQVSLGERRAVTAILVLCGLPYASFSSILAHEAMHAWMKLDPSFPSRLRPQVEEGMCQLIASLWLEHLAGRGTGDEGGGRRRRPGSPPSNEELRSFFAHQIKTDVSVVYGDGFRKAKVAYDAVGLDALLEHIKLYEMFPAV